MLTLIATPIGRIDEITLRSLELLKNAEVIICESTKETSKLLKGHGIKALRYEVLDEHSRELGGQLRGRRSEGRGRRAKL